VKTHRCDWSAVNGGSLYIYVPEEFKTFDVNREYELTVTTRFNLGYVARTPSAKYWMVFSTSLTAVPNPDRGWFEAIFEPCLFSS